MDVLIRPAGEGRTGVDFETKISSSGWIGGLARRHDRFGKFVAVGCINAVVSYSVFTLALLATYDDNVSVVITWCVGIVFNFFSTGRYVFGNRDFRRAIPFVLSYGISMVVNIALIDAFLKLGYSGLVAQALCLPVVVLVSYVLNAKLVFRQRAEPSTDDVGTR